MTSRLLAAAVGIALVLTCALALPEFVRAADSSAPVRTCAELFKQLNTERPSSQLDAAKAAASPVSQRRIRGPAAITRRTMVTEGDFTAVCVGTEQTPAYVVVL